MPELARGEITNAYRASNAAVQELHWLELNLQRLGVRLVTPSFLTGSHLSTSTPILTAWQVFSRASIKFSWKRTVESNSCPNN
jgi:hypothetical protein